MLSVRKKMKLPIGIAEIENVIFKADHFFTFLGQKLTDVPICSTHLSSNFITIIVAERWF